MRVTVSYSVELGEVLKELQMLYIRERNKLHSTLIQADKILKEHYSDKNLSNVAASIEECRTAVSNFDIKLTEISNILNGYGTIKRDLKQEPVKQAEEK
tara:strand:- start:859 stop:1155 length:297 start_codon:yes stop_codon:yes gene_type:complete